MALVTFEPDGAVLEVRAGTPLLAAILAARRPIGYACRGLGVCVSCRLQVWGAASAVDAAEAALLEVVRQRLRAGDVRGAASALRDFDRRFATAALREERDYLVWRIAVQGATPEAAARATRTYLRAHPRGIYSARVRGAAP